MYQFDYLAPTSLSEAIGALAHHGPEARVLAGGTDLLLRMKRGQWTPKVVINLKRIPGLREISFDAASGLRLGALATLNDLRLSPVIREHYPALVTAAGTMAGDQVRNIATVGGNVCNASPSADTATPLLVYEAQAVIAGPQGERRVPLRDFFVGPGKTVLGEGEILTTLHLPPPPANLRSCYLKLEYRQAMDIGVVCVAVALEVDADGVCRDGRVALGAVAPVPMRATQTETLLRGRRLTPVLADEAARIASAECSPIDDIRGSAWYRRHIVGVYVRRALKVEG